MSTRTRNWTCIFYVENGFNPDWFISKCNEEGVTAFVSPVHDKDVYTADDKNDRYKAGDLKKPHYHIVMLFGGVKSYKQVLDYCRQFDNTLSIVKPCISVGGSLAYLVHAKNKDKAQYDTKDVKSTADMSYSDALLKYTDKKLKSLLDILTFLRENNFDNFRDLVDTCLASGDADMLESIEKHVYIITNYLKSSNTVRCTVQRVLSNS